MKNSLLLKILFVLAIILLIFGLIFIVNNNFSNINKDNGNFSKEELSSAKKIGYNVINESLGLKESDVKIESIKNNTVRFFNKKDSTSSHKVYINVNVKNKSYTIETKNTIRVGEAN